MEGTTGVRDGYYGSRGACYAELVVDTDAIRVGLGFLVRRSGARLTAAIGPFRLVVGYLLVPHGAANAVRWRMGSQPPRSLREAAVEAERTA